MAVIGAGTAGIAAERAARKAGARTLLIDPEFRGTLCANTGCSLHLIEPLGFVLDDKRLRRAGLDYDEFASVQCHASLALCLQRLGQPRAFAFSTKACASYAEMRYQKGDAFLFGPETRGLPEAVRNGLPPEHLLRLPMLPNSRSLNLSNTVAVAVYEAWRQLGFA